MKLTPSMCASALILAAGMPAAAQRLPDPPPPASAGVPARLPNMPQFVDAYRRAGSPRLLIVADVVGAPGNTARTLNAAGEATRLAARVQDMFRHPDVIIVSPAAAGAARQGDVGALVRQDEYSAAVMLASQAGADVVMYVRMLEQQGRQDGVRYTGSYVVADVRRGQSLGSYAWDMTPDRRTGEFDAPRLGEYAQVIATRMASDFADAFPAGTPGGASAAGGWPSTTPSAEVAGGRLFTVRLLGDYHDEDITDFRDALRAIPLVRAQTVRLTREDTSTAQKMSQFDLHYAGDLADFRRDVRRAAASRLFMEAAVLGTRDGEISIRLNPLGLSETERHYAGGPETDRNRAAREAMLEGYARAGSPGIAVVINRIAVAEEASLLSDGTPAGVPVQSGETNIIVGTRVDLGANAPANELLLRLIDRELRDRRAERREDGELDVGMFEAQVMQRMLERRLNVVSVAGAQSSLAASPDFTQRAWTDQSLAAALGKEAGAGIVMSGVGKLVRDRATGRPVRVVFTLRAFSTENGQVLGAASVHRDLNTGQESFNQSIDELASEAVGKVVSGMARRWTQQP